MLPRWHIFWGIIFCLIFKLISPETNYFSLFLILFASVFIDFDHYITAAFKHGKWGPKEAIDHHYELRERIIDQKKETGVCQKEDFHIFHTVEAHILIGLLGLFFNPFFFIFIGMVLHSILDIIWMVRHDVMDSREFFLIKKLQNILL